MVLFIRKSKRGDREQENPRSAYTDAMLASLTTIKTASINAFKKELLSVAPWWDASVYTGRGGARASSYLSWSDLIAVVHRHQVVLAYSVGHMQGDSGHEGGPVEQVSIEAVVFGQTLLVVGATGPLPLSPHCLQRDACWEGMMPAGMQGQGRDTPRTLSPGKAYLCGGERPAPPPRWPAARGGPVSAPTAVGSGRP